jgi:hypothetical protein
MLNTQLQCSKYIYFYHRRNKLPANVLHVLTVSAQSAINKEREPYSTQRGNWYNSYARLGDTDRDAVKSKCVCHLRRPNRCRVLLHTSLVGYTGPEGMRFIIDSKLLYSPQRYLYFTFFFFFRGHPILFKLNR